jgi:hypothetical protein
MVWYKCALTKQDLLIHESGFGSTYKLINGYVARTDGAIELSVVTERDAFRDRGAPTPSPMSSPEPLEASITPAKSTSSINRSPSTSSEVYPFIANAIDWTPTGCEVLSGYGTESEPFKIDEGEELAQGLLLELLLAACVRRDCLPA